jgi:acetyl esterase/lipase
MAGGKDLNTAPHMSSGSKPQGSGEHRSPLDERRKEFWVQRFRRAHHHVDRPGETRAKPPEQPASGPGGRTYAHLRVIAGRYGTRGTAYWVFEPAAPSPRVAPVVVLLHGWGGTDPLVYGAWIDHLVMRGNVVLFPLYQTSVQSSTERALANTVCTLQDILRSQKATSHLQYDWERFAIIGHSAGGLLAAQVAAVAAEARLPQPKAVMAMHPSRGRDVRHPLPRVGLQLIPPSTLLLIMAGRDDQVAGDREGRFLFLQTPQIAPKNKNFVTVVSDFHGTPPLVANHSAPLAPRKRHWAHPVHREEPSTRVLIDLIRLQSSRADALNYHGYWKLCDALTDTAFYGMHREYALGNTQQQRFMGTWSDGVPVTELVVGAPYL